MIGKGIGGIGGQKYDSMDDMFRDNGHFDSGYRLNKATRGILDYRSLPDVRSYIMLAYGDTTTGGVRGVLRLLKGDIGVVDYTNYQPHPRPFGFLDKAEYGRRKRFSLYESLYNMRNDGRENDGRDLDKSPDKAEWENGGDDYLRNFPRENTTISIFSENVNLRNQRGDDGENYTNDHSDLAQRMMAMKLIVNGEDVNTQPRSGKPKEIDYSEEKPGTVVFSWSKSEDQADQDTNGHIGGQLYEVIRRIKGNKAIQNWEDKWWHRVALKPAKEDGNSDLGNEFDAGSRSVETIRSAEEPTVWSFYTSDVDETNYMPTWLDQSFNNKDLWVRVLNGPLEGGFFKVTNVQDYVGIGYTNKGALGNPPDFLEKIGIKLTVEENAVFGMQKPKKENYLTLGGIKYEYNAAFYGPNSRIRKAVLDTNYTNDQENDKNKGTGHFFSVELEEPVSHETDTISPTISFYDLSPYLPHKG